MTRRVVTDVGADGRSRVVSDGPPPGIFLLGRDDDHQEVRDLRLRRVASEAPSVVPGPQEVLVTRPWSTTGVPPLLTGLDPDAAAGDFQVECPPGATQWLLTRYGSDVTTAMHCTRTLDLQYVIDGATDLILDDEVVHLQPGDSVVLTGVRHAWRTGPGGGTRLSLVIGLDQDGGVEGER